MSDNLYVCIADVSPRRRRICNRRGISTPVIGQIYSIRSRCPIDAAGVLLNEIHNDHTVWILHRGGATIRVEPSFKRSQFRPVKKTDISVFTSLLASTPQKLETV